MRKVRLPAPARARGPPFRRSSAKQKMSRLSATKRLLAALALTPTMSALYPSTAGAQTEKPAKPAAPPVKAPAAAAPEAPAAAAPKAPATTAPKGPAPSEPAPDADSEADADAPETEEPTPSDAAPAPAPAPTAPMNAGLPLWPEPSADAHALERQGDKRPEARPGDKIDEADRVYAEDWWAHARPILEIHGYFRLRAQLFHKFGLGRLDPLARAMWPRPEDDRYQDTDGQLHGAQVCTPEERGGTGSSTASATQDCQANMQAGANLRFRLNPELHISDNLRVLSQIDLLDNLVLGSTPSGYANLPSADGGYAVSANGGYTPLGFYDDTQVPPSAGVNSLKDSIRVKRAWGEYSMPIGELRFGRMPFHWGLGIMWNGGDGHDDDAQSTVDRVQAISGIKPLDLYFSAAWDFPNEGITSDTTTLPNPEPYDLSQLDDVDQYAFSIVRKKSPELERLSLARGEVLLNGGLQLVYRHQTVANDRAASSVTSTSGDCADGAQALGCPNGTVGSGYVRRDATAWIPSLWLKLQYQKFRFEAEAITVQGSIGNIDPRNGVSDPSDPGYTLASWGFATELEQKLVEDRLILGFKFGWAEGDPDVDGLVPGMGSQAQRGDRTFSEFRFHPSYRIDMILNRNILTRVQGSYYFRPSADYDFLRDPNGQRVGGGLAAIWTRASEFIQAPGHDRDLGIELNGRLYYQAKDGALNDLPGSLGGFFTEVDYGVLFPMAGLGYTSTQADAITRDTGNPEYAQTRIAQTVRWYLGVLF